MQKSGFISIIGRPNAGKSTLLNHLLGMQLSIVTPKAQTTRERVLGILTEAESQIVFVDTPGIHRAREGGLNQYMVNEAKEALEAPHLIWYLVDPNSAVDYELTVLELLEKSSAPVFLVMNKADTLRNEILKKNAKKLESDLLAEMQKRNIQAQGAFSISALQKAGTQELLTRLKLLECPRRVLSRGRL